MKARATSLVAKSNAPIWLAVQCGATWGFAYFSRIVRELPTVGDGGVTLCTNREMKITK